MQSAGAMFHTLPTVLRPMLIVGPQLRLLDMVY
jgi:hypothetical protein